MGGTIRRYSDFRLSATYGSLLVLTALAVFGAIAAYFLDSRRRSNLSDLEADSLSVPPVPGESRRDLQALRALVQDQRVTMTLPLPQQTRHFEVRTLPVSPPEAATSEGSQIADSQDEASDQGDGSEDQTDGEADPSEAMLKLILRSSPSPGAGANSVSAKCDQVLRQFPYFKFPLPVGLVNVSQVRHVSHGILLKDVAGAPVLATLQGDVKYAGSGYAQNSQIVVVESRGGVYTIYDGLRESLVRKGKYVKQGDQLGFATLNLRFEVRVGQVPADPFCLLFTHPWD